MFFQIYLIPRHFIQIENAVVKKLGHLSTRLLLVFQDKFIFYRSFFYDVEFKHAALDTGMVVLLNLVCLLAATNVAFRVFSRS